MTERGSIDPLAAPSGMTGICAHRPAGIDEYRSLMGQGRRLFGVSTLSGACVLCVLVRHLMG
jgi:hypothetical protein